MQPRGNDHLYGELPKEEYKSQKYYQEEDTEDYFFGPKGSNTGEYLKEVSNSFNVKLFTNQKDSRSYIHLHRFSFVHSIDLTNSTMIFIPILWLHKLLMYDFSQ